MPLGGVYVRVRSVERVGIVSPLLRVHVAAIVTMKFRILRRLKEYCVET
jgi:hypothetical protein